MTRARGAPQVHKFGGASLADAGAVRHAVQIVARFPAGETVVVVSAMAGVTDRLLELARRAARGEPVDEAALDALRRQHLDAIRHATRAVETRRALVAALDESLDELRALLGGLRVVRELTARTSDHVTARGERLSALLMAGALADAGRKVRLVDALKVIATDGTFGNASPDFAATDRRARAVIAPLLAKGVVPVVPGFIGASRQGELVTLGRGGSDLTATLLARALGATAVNLWKDVPGFLTSDPRVVADARVIPQLHAREAAELAYYGAKVLHPRALIPLKRRSIPVYVRPFAEPDATGTEVSERRARTRSPVRAVSGITGQALVTVTGNGMIGVPGIAARTFEAMHQAGLSVTFITQSSSEHSITFGVPVSDAEAARTWLEKEFRDEIARQDIDRVELRRGMATVAVVGLGMAGARGVAARVFGALAHAGINIVAIAQGSSELNISFVIEESDAAEAQRAVHEAFQLAKIGGGAVNPPERVAVVLLGFGQVGRTLARLIPRASRPGIRLEVSAVIDRSGFVFDPAGLSPREVKRLADEKAKGRRLGEQPNGTTSTSSDAALAFISTHALPRPVVVDVTADDTAAILRHVLASGMDVVLANKRPLTERGSTAQSLHALARSRGQRLLFEATVGAGLPIIDTAAKLLESGDRIHRIDGCLSGTLGFLLSELGDGKAFSTTVREAMRRGYAEPDPREDLSGMDVARKALILGPFAGFAGDMDQVVVESLVPARARSLPLAQFLGTLEDYDAEWCGRVEAAKARGEVLRYVASVTRKAVRVGLASVPASSALGGLRGTDNQVVFTTDRYSTHPLVITGPGAGLEVTAAGVMNDVMKLAPA
jgi:aspartokinase/homoserine dehydrogenase 1